jgi:MYXO-CTERM domain-containing protein
VDGTIVAYDWDYGDGNVGSDVNPTHTYAAAGTFTVTLTVTDNDGATDAATTTCSVEPTPNEPPVADPNGPYSGTAGVPVAFDGSGSYDVDGTIVAYDWDYGDGNVGSGMNPTHTYAVAGTFTVTLTVTDDDGATDTATTACSVEPPPNEPPSAGDQDVVTDEDTPVDFTLMGSDPEGQLLTYAISSPPTNGALTGTAPDLTYMPSPDYNGPDSLTFIVNDGTHNSSPATVSLTVNSVNDAPVAYDQSVVTPADTPVGITLIASDVDQDSLTFSVLTGPSHGTLSGTAPNVTYVPHTGYSGPDSFTFLANDSQANSNVATVTVSVEGAKPPCPGTRTPGYWKNHPEAWPVEEIIIGNVTYTKAEAIELMLMPERGDKTYTLFRALVAARLNVETGNPSDCVQDTISAADSWMVECPVGSGVHARGKDSPWRDAEPLYIVLDDYNNGSCCGVPPIPEAPTWIHLALGLLAVGAFFSVRRQRGPRPHEIHDTATPPEHPHACDE